MSAGFTIGQLSGQWVQGFSIGFNINPPGSGTGGSAVGGLGAEDDSGYTKTTTPRQRLLEDRHKTALSDTLLLAMQEDDELILFLMGEF